MMDPARKARWAVAAMFAANGFIMGAWAPQIPLLLPRHDITEAVLGLLILVLGLGAVGSMLFAGRLIARFGSRRVLRVFAGLSIIVLPLVVHAPSLWLLVPAMALFGGIIGCMDVAMNAQAVQVERRLGRAIMSSSHGFWSLGGFVGGLAGSLALARSSAETQSLLTALVVAALVLGAMPLLLAESRIPAPVDAPVERHPLLPKEAGLWIIGLMTLFSMVPEGAVMDWAALYLSKGMGADLATAGLAFSFFAGTMALIRFAGDAVRNRFGAVPTLRYSSLIAAAGLAGAAVAPTPALAIACFAFCGLGVANMVPILFSAAGNYPGYASGAGIAAATMVGYSGILIAPSSIGFVAEHIGFRPTYAALSLLLVIVASQAHRAALADANHGAEAPSVPPIA